MHRHILRVAVPACFALTLVVSAARADILFQASLLGANEVPPVDTPATGFIALDLHDDLVTLDVVETFSGLLSDATAAHIHCCAPEGTNAPVVLPFTAAQGFPFGATSGTFTHTFDLNTDLTGITPVDFVAELESGQTYANIHDALNPGGEIRGQLAAVPEPNSFFALAGCLLALGAFRWFRRQTD
jgi:hypothetical protein